MKHFVAICAKAGQRVEMVVQYPSLEIARDELHKQGYSIMEIRETEAPTTESGGVFLFDILVNGEKKSGQIKSNDIFKAYTKLVDDLGYEVINIYSPSDITNEDKALTTTRVKEGYSIYKNLSKPEEKNTQTSKWTSVSEKNFFEKDLQKYGILIENIIKKIETLLLKYNSYIDVDRATRLKSLIVSLRQIKSITNVNKICLIGEAALLKIGELEKELVEKQTEFKREEFFKETNTLLKQFGSNKRILTEKDLTLSKLKDLSKTILQSVFETESKKENAPEIEENAFLYYKNLRELDIYKNKLKETNKDIFARLFHFSFKGDTKIRLLLKRKLIEQNINLLNNRISQRNIPYMRIIKGISYYTDVFFYLIRSTGDLLLYSLFLYSLGFFTLEVYSWIFSNGSIHHASAYFLAISAIIGFFLKQIRSTISLIFSSSAILFSIVFFVINF